jgi:zinc D-Ala-D-Ala carboxypeptidase
MQLSKHFTLSELTRSQSATRRGIKNIPDETQVANLAKLCFTILEPMRMRLGRPVFISSGYRCPELNALIGGSMKPPSQHMQGQAADLHVDGMTPPELFHWIVEVSGLPFDQVIEEFGEWVHVSWSETPRHMALVAFKNDEGETEYRRVS